MTQKTIFKKTFSEALQPAGFVQKGQSWYLDGADAITVLNLQKSDFDEKYYVNVGIWIKGLGSASFPTENKCHIQTRLTSLFPDDVELIETACRVDEQSARLLEFSGFLRDTVVPVLVACSGKSGLRSMSEEGQFRRALVMKEAKEWLAT